MRVLGNLVAAGLFLSSAAFGAPLDPTADAVLDRAINAVGDAGALAHETRREAAPFPFYSSAISPFASW